MDPADAKVPPFTGAFAFDFKQRVTKVEAHDLVRQIVSKVKEMLPDRKEEYNPPGPRVRNIDVYSLGLSPEQNETAATFNVLDLTDVDMQSLRSTIKQFSAVDRVYAIPYYSTVSDDGYTATKSPTPESPPFDSAFVVKFERNIDRAKASDLLNQILGTAQELLPEQREFEESAIAGGHFHPPGRRIHNVNVVSLSLAQGQVQTTAFFNVLRLTDNEKHNLKSMVESLAEVQRVNVVQNSSVVNCIENPSVWNDMDSQAGTDFVPHSEAR